MYTLTIIDSGEQSSTSELGNVDKLFLALDLSIEDYQICKEHDAEIVYDDDGDCVYYCSKENLSGYRAGFIDGYEEGTHLSKLGLFCWCILWCFALGGFVALAQWIGDWIGPFLFISTSDAYDIAQFYASTAILE